MGLAWHLAAGGFRPAVYAGISPDDVKVASGDNARGSVRILLCFVCLRCRTWTKRCLTCHEWISSWLVLEHVINMSGDVYINDTLVWRYEWEGSYVPCSHLRVTTSRRFVAKWTTSKEVSRVRLRVERFVEVGPRAGRLVEAWYILDQWSSTCMVCLGS